MGDDWSKVVRAVLQVGEQCIGEIARAAMRVTGVVVPRDPVAIGWAAPRSG